MLNSIIIFIFGSVIGSFLNVCIHRIPKEESIVFPSSSCVTCGHRLTFLDLIPIFSWIFLKGKCRYCGENISKQYPIIELLTGVLFIFLYLEFGFTIQLLKYIVLTSILIVIAAIDIKTQDVYDSTIIILGISGIIFIIIELFLYNHIDFIGILFGVLVPVFILSIFSYFGVMGWGDVEIIGCIGLFLFGILNILNLLISIFTGGICASVLIIFKRRSKNQTMAFGQFISISSYITLLFGSEILKWYLDVIV